eukprot:CAMPEP_0183371032 /NCGR_PEP_ID=MMETSP0164_2-20130417/104210_1 /TAXON_ID=221442 /ORGANISM="Coccolithus pelagicus ssp braarudi, Strain PLY182g" /LENGTH=89 /DNA_ID=CAMNT_0025547531 /DNA_START=241 /DNA_END=512 /DNA_ORIENTATION=-
MTGMMPGRAATGTWPAGGRGVAGTKLEPDAELVEDMTGGRVAGTLDPDEMLSASAASSVIGPDDKAERDREDGVSSSVPNGDALPLPPL